MAVVFGIWPLRSRVGRWMFVAAFGFGLATIAFGLSRTLPMAMVSLILLGAADMINIVIRQSVVQLDTPDAMRGRVASVSAVFIGASNQLGEFESGLTASWWGVVPAILFGGVGTLVVAVAWIRLFPALWHRDTLQQPEPLRSRQ
ncbi:MAG: MFS transporter [Burkholderiaceae bacterium]